MLKDSKSLEVSCYVLGAGAFGVFFRWMQLQLAYNSEGLPGKSVWNFFVILLIAAGAAVFWYFVIRNEKAGLTVPDDFFSALSNPGKLYAVLGWFIGLIMVAGSVMLFLTCELDMNANFLRVLSGFGAITGISFPLLLICANKPHVSKNGMVTLLSFLPLLFFATWLLTSYKQNSINPIGWDYAVEVLTLIVDLLAFFRIAGFAYGVPDAKKSMFLCMFGAMLSLMCLADNRYLAQQVMFFAAALMLTMYNWIMIANLVPAPKKASVEEESDEDEIVERL